MGWKKWIKKQVKKVTKPITKVFKGVAKGISKVGKAVMRGVSKLQKKLGPLGMIAMAVAMPYALSGLSSMTTGMMNYGLGTAQATSPFSTFIRAVGNVGNQIRTGYQIGSGMIGDAVSVAGEKFASLGNSITDTIAKTFQKFSGGGSGGAGGKDNWWTRISKGARNLFNSAKSVVTGQPKVGTVQIGGESVGGLAKDSFTLSSQSASELIGKGGINLSQPGALSNQTLGFTTRASDKLVTETINKAAEKQISQLGPTSLRHYNDINNAYKANNTYLNNQQALDAVLESQGTSYQGITDFDGLYNTDLGMTGDYKLLNPNEPTSYTFTGDKTFDNPVAKKFKYRDKIKKYKKYAGALKDTLFAPRVGEIIEPDQGAFVPTMGAEFAGSIGASLSATDIKGAAGSSSYANVFGDAAWEKLRAYHKHMNYQGST